MLTGDAVGRLAVFIADGVDGYVERLQEFPDTIEADGIVYTRRTMLPDSPKEIPEWYLYTEHEPGGATFARASQILRLYLNQGKSTVVAAADIFASAPAPAADDIKPQLRRQRRMARLRERGDVSDAEFAALSIENVCRMYHATLRKGDHLHRVAFAFASIQAMCTASPAGEYNAADFGPAPDSVGRLYQYLQDAGAAKELEPAGSGAERTIVWGERCEALLTEARWRYHAYVRLAYRVDGWTASLRAAFPNISNAVILVLSVILTAIVTWLFAKK